MFELVSLSSQHGFMMEPPARNCMWRYGFNSPTNYNDNELFCGGFKVLLYIVSIFLSSFLKNGLFRFNGGLTKESAVYVATHTIR